MSPSKKGTRSGKSAKSKVEKKQTKKRKPKDTSATTPASKKPEQVNETPETETREQIIERQRKIRVTPEMVANLPPEKKLLWDKFFDIWIAKAKLHAARELAKVETGESEPENEEK